MSASRWAQIASLFDKALELAPEVRLDWLHTVTGGDAEMRREVQLMLAAHEQSGILDHDLARRFDAADLQQRVSEALADRYEIERPLGSGGMATVFLARELKHSRQVVLKVLHPRVAARWGPDRFEREVRIAAQLAHPNIVGLIDSGRAGGFLFYVMPYTAGETLRERLRRDGALPIDAALDTLRDIADGLAEAHRAGIVHRDLKPENILCVGQHAYLLDFGIAKLIAEEAAQDHLTAPGDALGTPAYMAPEQIFGGAPVDQRADIFAWGVIAFEMLSGKRPPSRDVTAEFVLRRRPDAPAELARLIAECLVHDPRQRLGSAEEIQRRIFDAARGRTPAQSPMPSTPPAPSLPQRLRGGRGRMVAAGGTLGIGAIVALFLWIGSPPAPEPRAAVPQPVAVAVLANETGDPSLDSWGRMAGDWITQGLQETGLVSVVPWPNALQAAEQSAALRLAGTTPNMVALLRTETGAATVVTGSYYLIGDSLRFRVEVADAREGRLLGAPPPVSVLRDSAHVAVRLLRERLMSAVAIWSDDRFARLPGLTSNPPTYDAYQAFDQGLTRYVSQDYAGSIPDLRTAYARDTTFIIPLLYAVTAHVNRAEYDSAEALLAVVRARRGELTGYHRYWSEYLQATLAGDGTRALEWIRRAAAEAPATRASYNLAFTALQVDRPEEALAALQQLDPDRGDMRGWSSYWTQLAHALHLTGDHEGELAVARELRQRHPDRPVAHTLEARALAAAHRYEQLDSLFLSMSALPANTYWSLATAMLTAAEELLTHGAAEESRLLLHRTVAWTRAQLEVTPDYRPHQYWLATAYYELGEWRAAADLFRILTEATPQDVQMRGMWALSAARLGDRNAELLLGDHPLRQRGLHTSFRARLAAIRGEHARARALFAEAVQDGVNGLPWLHASAQVDLQGFTGDMNALPRSLRAETLMAVQTRR